MAALNYLNNQFDNMTIKRLPLMVKLTNDHIAKLQAQQSDADILPLLQRIEPLHNAFIAANIAFIVAKGNRKGRTLALTQLLQELSKKKIKQWDIQIQSVYLEGESRYTMLLPNRRSPFQQGAYDERIAEVNALAQRLQAEPSLAATKADVDAYYLRLITARDLQQQEEGRMAQQNALANQARKALAIMMFGNMGALMDKYRAQPQFVATFWETALLKQHRKPKKDQSESI